jgi:hypothetical protein
MDVSAELIAVAALIVLILVMRWVFAPSRPRRGPVQRPADASDARELGLLNVIATARPRDAAMSLRARLGDEQIRSSMSRRRDGTYDVLVFANDIERATQIVASDRSDPPA